MNFEAIRARLLELEDQRDERDWPGEALDYLGKAGWYRAGVRRDLGGDGIAPAELLKLYETVASASLTLALIITQHDGATDLIAEGENPELAKRLLPEVARGEHLLSVGISQLTTSRRSQGPAMRARREGDGFRLTGVMPWVTSATKIDWIVTGGVLDDGLQILAAVPADAPGITIGEPMQFAALTGSMTAEVRCADAGITPEMLIRAPVETVLAMRAPVKPLVVSSCGVGMARALLEGIEDRKHVLGEEGDRFAQEARRRFDRIRTRLYEAADRVSDPDYETPAAEIRIDVNDLIQRLSITYLTLAKGSGFLVTSKAQRLCREAMFFLVWSAKRNVQVGTIERILCSGEGDGQPTK